MKELKKLLLLVAAVVVIGAFVACSQDDDDDCPAGNHLYYTNSSGAHEYASDEECSNRAYSSGYKYYCYDGKCHAYNTKY